MTTIAWDGRHLAADKQSTSAGMGRTVTKVYRLHDGLIAFCGSSCHAAALLDWFQGNRDPKAWPREKDEDENADAVHITRGGVFVYCGGAVDPYPVRLEDKFAAFGSGRDFAMAAMHLGHDAREAVAVAAQFDTSTGRGIDVLELAA